MHCQDDDREHGERLFVAAEEGNGVNEARHVAWLAFERFSIVSLVLDVVRTAIPFCRHKVVSNVASASVLPIGHHYGVDAVAFARDRSVPASAYVDNAVRLWRVETGKGRRMLTGRRRGDIGGLHTKRPPGGQWK